jgi:hypothetical protein
MKHNLFRRRLLLLIAAVAFIAPLAVHAQDKKPNILVIWGDDIGGRT